MDTLLLNADYRPMDVLSWMDALSLMFREKAHVISEYEDWEVRSPSLTVRVPSILVLVKYHNYRPIVKFSRINVYSRDRFQCQYCGVGPGSGEVRMGDLTFDHVVPRSRGGKTTWDNIVTCCQPCNRTKADRLPREAGMPLRNEPYVPDVISPVLLRLHGKNYPDSWSPYVEPHMPSF